MSSNKNFHINDKEYCGCKKCEGKCWIQIAPKIGYEPCTLCNLLPYEKGCCWCDICNASHKYSPCPEGQSGCKISICARCDGGAGENPPSCFCEWKCTCDECEELRKERK